MESRVFRKHLTKILSASASGAAKLSFRKIARLHDRGSMRDSSSCPISSVLNSVFHNGVQHATSIVGAAESLNACPLLIHGRIDSAAVPVRTICTVVRRRRPSIVRNGA